MSGEERILTINRPRVQAATGWRRPSARLTISNHNKLEMAAPTPVSSIAGVGEANANTRLTAGIARTQPSRATVADAIHTKDRFETPRRSSAVCFRYRFAKISRRRAGAHTVLA